MANDQKLAVFEQFPTAPGNAGLLSLRQIMYAAGVRGGGKVKDTYERILGTGCKQCTTALVPST